jgi:hypothetical protein
MNEDRVQRGICQLCGKPGTLRFLNRHRGEGLRPPRWICAECWIADRITPADRYRLMWERTL